MLHKAYVNQSKVCRPCSARNTTLKPLLAALLFVSPIMIPDFASWTDHSNPEQGRRTGLLLDLQRLRKEYAEPEVRFARALLGLDPAKDGKASRPLSDCLTLAVDEEDYERAVATCSAREHAC